MNHKLLATLGLARRAGKLTWGFDMVTAETDKTVLVLLAADLSARTRRSLENKLQATRVQCAALEITMAELGRAIGTAPVGIIGVTEKGFAALLSAEIEKTNAGGTQL